MADQSPPRPPVIEVSNPARPNGPAWLRSERLKVSPQRPEPNRESGPASQGRTDGHPGFVTPVDPARVDHDAHHSDAPRSGQADLHIDPETPRAAVVVPPSHEDIAALADALSPNQGAASNPMVPRFGPGPREWSAQQMQVANRVIQEFQEAAKALSSAWIRWFAYYPVSLLGNAFVESALRPTAKTIDRTKFGPQQSTGVFQLLPSTVRGLYANRRAYGRYGTKLLAPSASVPVPPFPSDVPYAVVMMNQFDNFFRKHVQIDWAPATPCAYPAKFTPVSAMGEKILTRARDAHASHGLPLDATLVRAYWKASSAPGMISVMQSAHWDQVILDRLTNGLRGALRSGFQPWLG